mgnify:FL=1
MFLDGRGQEFTQNHDNNFTPINSARSSIDTTLKTATATVYGLKTRTAVYREGLGCVLIPPHMSIDDFLEVEKPLRTPASKTLTYPYGNAPQKDTVFATVDYQQLNQVVERAFKNNSVQKTRSVLVIYKDQIIAERHRRLPR